MSALSESLRIAVRFIVSLVNTFAQYPFPGTEIPVVYFMLAVPVIYFLWVVVLEYLTGQKKDGHS